MTTTEHSTSKRLLRISLSIRRNPKITSEEFDTYWTQTHAPLVQPWLSKHGVVRYVQYHTPTSLQKEAQSIFPDLASSSMHELPYDGTIEILVPDIACLARARDDPFYENQVRSDEEQFFDTENVSWNVGWEEVVIDDELRGKKKKDEGGGDGRSSVRDSGVGIDTGYVGGGLAGDGESHYLQLGHHGGDEGLGVEHLGERH